MPLRMESNPFFMNPEICQTVSNYKANNDTGKT